MTARSRPYVIDFPALGRDEIGYIAVSEFSESLPFEVKRVFWTYDTPPGIIRGRHAHHKTEMVLIAVSGTVVLETEMPGGKMDRFELGSPTRGVYMPPYCWHTMTYTEGAVQLVLTSTHYQAEDYIRDYAVYQSIAKELVEK